MGLQAPALLLLEIQPRTELEVDTARKVEQGGAPQPTEREVGAGLARQPAQLGAAQMPTLQVGGCCRRRGSPSQRGPLSCHHCLSAGCGAAGVRQPGQGEPEGEFARVTVMLGTAARQGRIVRCSVWARCGTVCSWPGYFTAHRANLPAAPAPAPAPARVDVGVSVHVQRELAVKQRELTVIKVGAGLWVLGCGCWDGWVSWS